MDPFFEYIRAIATAGLESKETSNLYKTELTSLKDEITSSVDTLISKKLTKRELDNFLNELITKLKDIRDSIS